MIKVGEIPARHFFWLYISVQILDILLLRPLYQQRPIIIQWKWYYCISAVHSYPSTHQRHRHAHAKDPKDSKKNRAKERKEDSAVPSGHTLFFSDKAHKMRCIMYMGGKVYIEWDVKGDAGSKGTKSLKAH
jgi:hypothetical protein